MHARTHRLVAPLLEAQHGLVTLAQLRALGLDRRLPRRSGWALVAPQVWCSTAPPHSSAVLVEAVRLYAGGRAVPSGRVACLAHGLRDVPAGEVVEALVPHGTRLKGGGLVVVRQTARLPCPVTRSGLRVAPVARAVADLSRWSTDVADVRALVLAALSDGFVLAEALERDLAAGQRHGRQMLSRALQDWSRGARSAPEAEAADALVATGRVPPFVLNPTLVLNGRFLGRPDGYLPGLGMGWEVDSVRHHGSSAALAATLGRHRDFADAGIELEHVVPAVLRRDPTTWAGRFARRVARRAAGGQGDPAGLTLVGPDGAECRTD